MVKLTDIGAVLGERVVNSALEIGHILGRKYNVVVAVSGGLVATRCRAVALI